MFNLACESVACEVATALQADKLIVFSQGRGLIRDNELIRYTTPHDCIVQGAKALSDHERRRLSSAARATTKGVERAHMVSYTEDGALQCAILSVADHMGPLDAFSSSPRGA